jgi:hypothetical protein
MSITENCSYSVQWTIWSYPYGGNPNTQSTKATGNATGSASATGSATTTVTAQGAAQRSLISYLNDNGLDDSNSIEDSVANVVYNAANNIAHGDTVISSISYTTKITFIPPSS